MIVFVGYDEMATESGKRREIPQYVGQQRSQVSLEEMTLQKREISDTGLMLIDARCGSGNENAGWIPKQVNINPRTV